MGPAGIGEFIEAEDGMTGVMIQDLDLSVQLPGGQMIRKGEIEVHPLPDHFGFQRVKAAVGPAAEISFQGKVPCPEVEGIR